MLPSLAIGTVIGVAGAFATLAQGGEAIYLKPGQCILVGGQQVCALAGDSSADHKKAPLYVCRYGMHEGAEIPDLKSYALFQVAFRDDGSKVETLIKQFGPTAKDQCEKEAEKREATGYKP